MKDIDARSLQTFKEVVWDYYAKNARTMPWREDCSLYSVLVSELMLQQTQVERVRKKYVEFMSRFPDVESLAAAGLDDVMQLWQGLGYNRRARFLHQAARQIVRMKKPPKTIGELTELAGVGKNTAGALQAYVYNIPSVFIETNIRTVYFYHFFQNETDVLDKQIEELVIKTVDSEHPREWYWALMDYGSYLKLQGVKNINVSKHYKKQSPLKGSVREVRGKIIKALTVHGPCHENDLRKLVPYDKRWQPAIDGLMKDGLISRLDKSIIQLTKE